MFFFFLIPREGASLLLLSLSEDFILVESSVLRLALVKDIQSNLSTILLSLNVFQMRVHLHQAG